MLVEDLDEQFQAPLADERLFQVWKEKCVQIVEHALDQLREHGKVVPALDKCVKQGFSGLALCGRKQVANQELIDDFFEVSVQTFVMVTLVALF